MHVIYRCPVLLHIASGSMFIFAWWAAHSPMGVPEESLLTED